MRARLIGPILAITLVALPAFGPAHAQTSNRDTVADARYADSIERGRLSIDALMGVTGIPGMSVAISIRNDLVWSEAFGLADVELQVPVTRDTRFRLASISKLVTTAAAARLVEAGKLDLDAPIRDYVADLPEHLQPITSRQILGHLSGIRHYQSRDYFPAPIDHRHFDTVRAGLALFEDDDLLHTPGTTYSYTTFGFSLLAAAMEGASGETFLDYLDAAVFTPLGMTASGPDVPMDIVPDRTRFYQVTNDQRVLHAKYLDPSYKWAGGGLLATAEDLIRFGRAHVKPGFHGADMLEEMMTRQTTTGGDEIGTGLCWRIANDARGRRFLHHSGSQNGSRAMLIVYPEQEVVAVFFSNLGGTPGLAMETNQFLAEPFLRRLEGDADAASGDERRASMPLSATLNEQAMPGTIEFEVSGGDVSGEMKMGPFTMPILDVTEDDEALTLTVAAPVGIVPVRLVKGDDGMHAQMRLPGNQRVELTVPLP